MRKECEELFMEKDLNPLPLPTLKLSEPPGAVRPDGIQPLLLAFACHRTVTSKLITISPIVPITIGIMQLKLNHQPTKAKSRFGTMNGASQQKMPGGSKAGKQKNKLSP
jgi:hypothetical protein